MPICVEGDNVRAQEVIQQVKLWDQAIIENSIDDVIHKCADRISLFDVSSQLTGIGVYRKEWEKFSPYFHENMKITRRDMTVYISEDLAVLHCYSKVDHAEATTNQMPWCRTTMCLQKQAGDWLLVHQHISMPVNVNSGQAILIKDVPKLKLVI